MVPQQLGKAGPRGPGGFVFLALQLPLAIGLLAGLLLGQALVFLALALGRHSLGSKLVAARLLLVRHLARPLVVGDALL